MLKSLRLALSFLTILPVGRLPDASPEAMAKLPGLYPAVGLVIGALACPAFLALDWAGLPNLAEAVLLAALSIVLTRGFHLDGLADCADALLSHRPLERKLEILKDSHLGTFGVAAIMLDILLKVALFSALISGGKILGALILHQAFGRLSASAVALWGRNAVQKPGLGFYMIEGCRYKELGLALLTSFLAGLILAGLAGVFVCLAALALGCILVRVWKAALGGVTGDLLGASVELGELLSLLLLAILLL